jgi:hypothetical protein
VTFKKGSDTYTFVASVADHGKLTARVDHPITNVTPAASSGSSASWAVAPAPSPSSSSGGGGSHEGGGQDD